MSRDGSQGGVGAPRQLGGMSPEGPYEDAQRSRDGSQGDTAFLPGFINHKAGMAGVDQERVKAVVKELTRGGQHHREESRKDANTEESIAKMKEMYASLSATRIREIEGSVRCRIGEMEAQRDLSRDLDPCRHGCFRSLPYIGTPRAGVSADGGGWNVHDFNCKLRREEGRRPERHAGVRSG